MNELELKVRPWLKGHFDQSVRGSAI